MNHALSTISLRKIVLIVLLAIFIPGFFYAQVLTKPVICGNEIFHDVLQRNYPGLLENINNTFENAHKAPRDLRSDPLEVHVVFHVIWNDPSENLADSIILNQLEVLNHDFNKLNADTGQLRVTFKPVAANANIHFNLASIVRVQTDVLFSVDILGTNLLTEVKYDADGGSDAWDPTHYINIWICKIQPLTIFGLEVGQVFGFSFPPNNLPNWPADNGAPTPGEDGLVIDFRAVGSNNPNTIVVPGTTDLLKVKGRTPVHEMGHYLGLRHIWGDGGLLGPNECDQSDGIDDTPFANAQSNFDCDTLKNTCTQEETFYNADVPDLVENFMDYASEECMVMFTQGQVDLMRNVILDPRSGLLEEVSATYDIAHPSAIEIIPNPATDILTIQLADDQDVIKKVSLMDFNGRIVQQQTDNYTLSKINLPIHDLPTGIYVVQVMSAKGSQAGKVIIQH
jgi:hypothetical protein